MSLATRATQYALRRWGGLVLRSYRINAGGRGTLGFMDVGAVGGLPSPWAENAWRIRFLLGFEPNGEARALAHGFIHNTALWETDGEREFYIYNSPRGTGSSLLEQNFDYVREHFDELKRRGDPGLAATWFERSRLVRTVKMRCESLDSVVAKVSSPVPLHFAKIDAQGAELPILRGGRLWLREQAVGLHLECFSVPLYKGMSLFDETAAFLKDFGFVLAHRDAPHGSFASQTDCLFLKAAADPAILAQIAQVYGIPVPRP